MPRQTQETEIRGQMTIPTQVIPKEVTSNNAVTEPVATHRPS